MKKTIIAMALIIAFLLGCAASRLAGDFTVPPARAGTDTTKWEYTCFKAPRSTSDIEKRSDKLGAEGWEMAAGNRMVYCFKRALP